MHLRASAFTAHIANNKYGPVTCARLCATFAKISATALVSWLKGTAMNACNTPLEPVYDDTGAEITGIDVEPQFSANAFANDARYMALVREGHCPECGRNEFLPFAKFQLVLTCAHCGAAYSVEDFTYGQG